MRTLGKFLSECQQNHHDFDPDLVHLLQAIASSCKQIGRTISRGALTHSMGSLDSENIHGDTQKHLDVITNDLFLQINQTTGFYAGMASEEMDEPYQIPPAYRRGGYLLLFDPLDGSSNVNVNISVGTIFSILRSQRPEEIGASSDVADYLQPGTQQICAGYALYGTSTMLVLTTGHGVNGFTLDSETGDFFLTHPAMQIPPDTQEFAINMSNQRFWELPVQRYVSECMQGRDGPRGKDFNMRWVASMVAEVHRLLVRGGVFMYPIDSKIRAQGGKLRLLYEASPMSWIVEQAGGLAITGHQRILELQPQDLHQRVPVILGARSEVERILQYHH